LVLPGPPAHWPRTTAMTWAAVAAALMSLVAVLQLTLKEAEMGTRGRMHWQLRRWPAKALATASVVVALGFAGTAGALAQDNGHDMGGSGGSTDVFGGSSPVDIDSIFADLFPNGAPGTGVAGGNIDVGGSSGGSIMVGGNSGGGITMGGGSGMSGGGGGSGNGAGGGGGYGG